MKRLLLILLSLTQLISVKAQCDFVNYSDAPDELFRKRVNEPGMRYGNPYTMFVKGDDFSLDKSLQIIRNNIIKGQPFDPDSIKNEYFRLFKDICDYANNPEPLKCSYNEECNHPVWVKNNAIVYLIGLRYSTDANGKGQFDSMTPAGCDTFFRRAHEGLRNLNPNVVSCWGGSDCGKVHFKAGQLVQYLQAYDLLKAKGGIPKNDGDRNGGSCTARNKLRQFARNLYVESDYIINSSLGWKKNHGIMCASALGVAAIVLNDAGVETGLMGNAGGLLPSIGNFIGGLFGSIIGEPWPHPKYSPLMWYQRAHGTGGSSNIGIASWGEDGIEDNFFKGDHANLLGSVDVPMTNADGTAGYAEGPTYFAYLSQIAWFQYLRASDNFLPKSSSKNYLAQQKYRNLLEWYKNIQNHDHKLPSYDNSSLENGNFIGVLGSNGDYNYKSNASFIPSSTYDLRGDYLLAMGAGEDSKLPNLYPGEVSGNIILRNETNASQQTFHMLCEKDKSVDKEAYDYLGIFQDGTHEDDDMGSFMIYAGDTNSLSDALAIDAPYFTSKESNYTNKYWMHNTIEVDDSEPSKNRKYSNPKYTLLENHPNINSNNGIQSFDLAYDYESTSRTANYAEKAIKRNVNAIKSDDNLYYFINDFVDVSNIALTVNHIQLNLNGNGNIEINDKKGLPTFFIDANGDVLYRWTYPCDKNKWSLTAHISALNNTTAGKGYWDENYTNYAPPFLIWDNADNSTRGNGVSDDYHTRLRIHQPVKKTIFQSFLYPQKCNWELPHVTKEETANHVTTTIKFVNSKDTSITRSLHKNLSLNHATTAKDTVSHFHFAQWDGMVDDSIINPFALPQHSSVVLKTNAQKAFVKHNTIGISVEGYKYCPPSYANIRHSSITNGSKLTIINGSDSLKLIEATKAVTTSLSFSARYFYVGHVKSFGSISSSDSVSFYLPDVGRGVDMCALHLSDTIPSRYDSLTNTFHMQLPSSPDYDLSFEIREKNKCADCYFPPAWMNIDTTFDADDGHNHTLGHKLKVKQNRGLLRVSNGTKIHMCEGVYLCNRDSIIIEGACQTKAKDYQLCKGLDTVAAHSSNSAIVVSPYSALVLDSGSYTYLKSGGAIYVKTNGSLVIRKGAFIQIGDSGTCQQGWGEIIADKGAYVYIDQSVYHDTTLHIEFRRTAGDTVDRNLFYIAHQATGSAFAGLSYNMIPILRADTIIPDSAHAINPIGICFIDTTITIKNKEWGYANFIKPLATYQVRNDTLCPGEPLYIKLNRLLNDTKFDITVCRVDSVYKRDKLGVLRWVDTCIVDTMSHDTTYPDPVCVEPRVAPDDLLFYFKTKSLHRIIIRVWNDCGISDDTVGYVYVMDTPKVSINMPSEICEGVGKASLQINKLNSFPISSYTIEITEVPDTSFMKERTGITQSYSKTFYTALPDSFKFDDYYFRGGRKYSISLTITAGCGGNTYYTETTVPLTAKIIASKPTIYGNRIGTNSSVQLNGYVNMADSFTWTPSYGLNRTDALTVLSSITQDTSYVLTAYKGACIARDTVRIRYNTLSYIGNNDTLCGVRQVFLGNRYNAALFLGWLNYQDVGIKTLLKNQIQDNLIANGISDDNYLKYFNSFMFTTGFTDYEYSSCYPYYTFFTLTETAIWDSITDLPEFATYYNNFVNNMDDDLNVLDQFTRLIKDNTNTSYKNYFDEHLMDESSASCIVDKVIPSYIDYAYNNYKRLSTSAYYVPLDISWYKITKDTIEMRDWKNQYAAIDSPIYTTTYLQQVYHSSGLINIDSKTIFIDTALAPLYYPSMQWDSSAYFTNATSPISSTNTYLWDFGDGSAKSTDVNPFHTFPAFNTHYIVCLTATNSCGSPSYCDTVWIDSLHIGGSFKVIASSDSEHSEESDASYLSKTKVTSNCQLSNYPNPFDQSTIIDYEIWQT
ncbi:MAG: hypothetical protein EBZ58_09075, partial [Bacteroidetes bacterium]|nr:hypothetical protein [Bacteroidota bacterium]